MGWRLGMELVVIPFDKIIVDVLADVIEGMIMANAVLVVVSLPKWSAGGIALLVNATGHGRLECPHNCT